MSDFDEGSEGVGRVGSAPGVVTSGTKRPIPSPSPTTMASSSTKSAKRSKTQKGSPPNSDSSSSNKSNRGLRHFSMMVCKKVEEKGTTTYNEVADELVRKVIAERAAEQQQQEASSGTATPPPGKFDEKNIRRRVYDALNVLMAMDIISKEKKEITWKGLPTGYSKSSSAPQDLESLREEVQYRQDQIRQKREALRELLVQQVCFRNLVQRNMHKGPSDEKIPLPFIVVNTHRLSVIQCDMSGDRTDVMFDFSMPFEINDDNTILKKMGMDRTSTDELNEMIPQDMFHYCQGHQLLDTVVDQHPSPPGGLRVPHPIRRSPTEYHQPPRDYPPPPSHHPHGHPRSHSYPHPHSTSHPHPLSHPPPPPQGHHPGPPYESLGV